MKNKTIPPKSKTMFGLIKEGSTDINKVIKFYETKPTWNKIKSDNSLQIDGNNAKEYDIIRIEIEVEVDGSANLEEIMNNKNIII